MCDCQSSTHPASTGSQPERVIDPRPYFEFCTKNVAVDACIADDILSLWKAGIFTRLSCCHHNRTNYAEVALNYAEVALNYAEVALHDIDDTPRAVEILRRTGRDWRVLAHTVTPTS